MPRRGGGIVRISDRRCTTTTHSASAIRGNTPLHPHPTCCVLRPSETPLSYGNEVKDEEAWPAQLEALTGLEVLTAGIGGYGTDQAYLAYRRFGRSYNARIVLIGFTTADMYPLGENWRFAFGWHVTQLRAAVVSTASSADPWSFVGTNAVASSSVEGGGYPVPPGSTIPAPGTCRPIASSSIWLLLAVP